MCRIADSFYAAVKALTNEGPVKSRLHAAYVEHLESLRDDEVPDSIRTRFGYLRAAMQAFPANARESAVQVSIRKMSEADARNLCRSILAMLAELVRVKETGERLGGTPPPEPKPTARLGRGLRVPAFLARNP